MIDVYKTTLLVAFILILTFRSVKKRLKIWDRSLARKKFQTDTKLETVTVNVLN